MTRRLVVVGGLLFLLTWAGAAAGGYKLGLDRGKAKVVPPPHVIVPLSSNDAYVFAQQPLLRQMLQGYGYVFGGGWDFPDAKYGRYFRIKYLPASSDPDVQRKLQVCINVYQEYTTQLPSSPESLVVERFEDGFYRVIRMGAFQRCREWKPLKDDPALDQGYEG